MSFVKGLMNYINESPSNYHSIASQIRILSEAGFEQLRENENWKISTGRKYYVNRNDSAIIAFAIPEVINNLGVLENVKFNIMASHCDSPALKIKNNPDMTVENCYVKLNVEGYGGGIWHTWVDRPLSIAGRIFVQRGSDLADTDCNLTTKAGDCECQEILVDINKNICMIPSLAIHMNRDINKGYEWNIQKDMLPLMTINPDKKLMDIVAEAAGVKTEDIISHDLYLYNRDDAIIWGAEDEFIAAPRLDDQACAYASLMAICEASGDGANVSCGGENMSEFDANMSCDGVNASGNAIMVHAVFDNEEVGSSTIQGACSTFLKDTFERIVDCLGLSREEYHKAIANSFMFSADNAHALHPNYPEKCDPTNRPLLGKGVVLKFAGNQKYTTDGASAARTRSFARECGIELQTFHNKSDMAGGSTLGNLSANQVPVSTADIGIAQLAMHSCYETIAACDVDDMVRLAARMFRG